MCVTGRCEIYEVIAKARQWLYFRRSIIKLRALRKSQDLLSFWSAFYMTCMMYGFFVKNGDSKTQIAAILCKAISGGQGRCFRTHMLRLSGHFGWTTQILTLLQLPPRTTTSMWHVPSRRDSGYKKLSVINREGVGKPENTQWSYQRYFTMEFRSLPQWGKQAFPLQWLSASEKSWPL